MFSSKNYNQTVNRMTSQSLQNFYRFGYYCWFNFNGDKKKFFPDKYQYFKYQNIDIFYDSENQFTFKINDSHSCFLILLCTTIIDIKNDSHNIDLIAERILNKLTDSETSFFDYLDYLAGRYIIIYHQAGKTKVLHDACGTRSVYYYQYPSKETVLISSHLDLIHKITEVKPLDIKDEWMKSFTYYMPGNLTPLNQVYILTPNTLLQVNDYQIIRYFPRENLEESSDIDSIVDYISSKFVQQLTLLSESKSLLFSLSAGLDSRTTVSASKFIKEKSTYFTYYIEEQGFNSRVLWNDLVVGKSLFNFLEINHKLVIKSSEDILFLNPDYRDYYQQFQSMRRYLIHSPSLPYLYRQYFSSDVLHIRSNLYEFVYSNWLGKNLANEEDCINFTEHTAFKLFLINNSYKKSNNTDIDLYQNFIKRYLKQHLSISHFDEIQNYNPVDMFYWEFYVGTWHSASVLSETDYAFDTYTLINCRSIIKSFLSIPLELRKTKIAIKSIINKLWPELLKYPINPNTGFYHNGRNSSMKRVEIPEFRDNTAWNLPNNISLKTTPQDKNEFTIQNQVDKLYISTGLGLSFEQPPQDYAKYLINPISQYEMHLDIYDNSTLNIQLWIIEYDSNSRIKHTNQGLNTGLNVIRWMTDYKSKSFKILLRFAGSGKAIISNPRMYAL